MVFATLTSDDVILYLIILVCAAIIIVSAALAWIRDAAFRRELRRKDEDRERGGDGDL